jgi:hypothetical protein
MTKIRNSYLAELCLSAESSQVANPHYYMIEGTRPFLNDVLK